MRTSHVQILIPIFLTLAAVGCTGSMVGTTSDGPDEPVGEPGIASAVEILSPVDGDILPSNFVRISGTSDAATVVVNGEEVDVTDGRFETALEMPDGPATVEARTGDVSDSVSFTVDGGIPELEITTPARGAFIVGTLLMVQGRVFSDDVHEVDVDGHVVPVNDDGSFSYSEDVPPGAYHIRVSATDVAGHTGWAMTSAMVGAFQDVETDVERAAVLQLGGDALDEIGDGIAPHISPSNLEPAILSYGHLADGFWGWLDAQGYDHGAVEVTVEPNAGSLTVTVTIDDIRLPLRADLRIGPDITGTAAADRAVATVTARLSTSAGRPVVTVTETDVTIYGLLVDIDGLWSWLDRNVVTNLVRGRVSSELDGLAASRVPPALEGAIERIPTTQVVRQGGKSVIVRGEVRSLIALTSGIRAMLDLGVSPIGTSAELEGVPGFLTLNPGYPDITATRDVRAQINLDLVNAAMHAAWSTGGLETSLVSPDVADSPLTAGALGYFAPGTRGAAPADAPVTVHVAPLLPPVLQPTDDDATLIEARVADIAVLFTAEVDGVDVELFELALGVTAPVGVSIMDDEITVDASGWSIRAQTIGDTVGLPQGDDLDAFLSALLGPALEDLVVLEGLRMPQLYGFDATDLSLDLDDGYLVAEARLTHAP